MPLQTPPPKKNLKMWVKTNYSQLKFICKNKKINATLCNKQCFKTDKID
jgi:hypothetical protein